jgi:hypothetical protein
MGTKFSFTTLYNKIKITMICYIFLYFKAEQIRIYV